MAIKTIELESGDSYTAPEGGFVGRLHGKIIDTASCNPPSVIIKDPLDATIYTLQEDVDYVIKIDGSDSLLCYPGVPIQLEEDYKLEITSPSPTVCFNSFILMGYTDE